MAYVYLDDGFAEHPKILAISDAALRLHIDALCYANRQLTDGHVPPHLVGQRWRAAESLVTHKLWDRTATGWVIHDYLQYQKSAGQVRKLRDQAAERKRRQRGDVTP